MGKQMTLHLPKQLPISLQAVGKTDMRTQFGALVYSIVKGKTQVLLITTRGSKRWVIPKGWPMTGLTPAAGALQEAWEEAGVRGKTFDHCLGLYSYRKSVAKDLILPCLVMVYPVKAKKLINDFPEKGQRRRKWMSPDNAAKRVSEPELARIIATFDPRQIH